VCTESEFALTIHTIAVNRRIFTVHQGEGM
ncbi:MAG: hypothetical protein ACI8UX_002391, partial [Psychromonas sp.]